MTPANYLVEDALGTLHSYWRLEILLIDLTHNGGLPPKRLFKKVGSLRVQYVPTTEAELRAEMAVAS